MKVVLCQTNIAWEDRRANLARVREMLAAATVAESSLVILPEMFSSGFSMRVDKIAESEPSETEGFLSEMARTYKAAFIAGLVTQDSRAGGDQMKGRNELLALGAAGESLLRYQKMRTFRYSDEPQHYQRGRQLFIFDWQGLRICPLICYDLRFPELFRRGVSLGAQVFVVIANWPTKRQEHWRVLLRARAIENQAYVIGVNRCGSDPNNDYAGSSMVIDPLGKVLVDAGKETSVVSAELSVDVVESWREEFPALKDLEI